MTLPISPENIGWLTGFFLIVGIVLMYRRMAKSLGTQNHPDKRDPRSKGPKDVPDLNNPHI